MTQPITTPPPNPNEEKGRGPLILGLGIGAILVLGPFLGVPAWIMGWSDLKKVRAGRISQERKGLIMGGMITGIVGTFFSPAFLGCAIAVGLSILTAEHVGANRDALINDINQIAVQAQKHYLDNSSYEGFEVSTGVAQTENGAYQVSVLANGDLVIQGVSSIYNEDAVVCTIDRFGKTAWTFQGPNFSP